MENSSKEKRCVYYRIGGITIQVEADQPIRSNTFHTKLEQFKVTGPGEDTVYIRHHFFLPDLKDKDLGENVYHKPPWSIYKKEDFWTYLGIFPDSGVTDLHRVAVFNNDHSRAEIYHPDENAFKKGNSTSLTFLPTDQIFVARLLADRKGCYLHSSAVIYNGKGLTFAGHSEAGKSTVTAMMQKHGAEVLCDDRNIIKQGPEGFTVYGSWSNGDILDISASYVPLHAIFFLEQSKVNQLVRISDKKVIFKKLVEYLIKPMGTFDWWEKELELLDQIAGKVPVYMMLFNKGDEIIDSIKKI
ncbi:MAG: hypothetical protein K8S15_00190 [Candidatus Aegiribacteria sp.]|nr:hypothetical protein [Candidatus Aegiribacteria sp.]